jgi:hypothetical protein
MDYWMGLLSMILRIPAPFFDSASALPKCLPSGAAIEPEALFLQ